MSISFLSTNSGIISTPFVNIGGSAKCLSIGGSAAALGIANNGTGLFQAACQEKPPVADTTAFSLSLNVYPNPTRGSAMLRASGEFDANLFCIVRVVAMDGKVILGERVAMSKIKAGYQINGNAWAAGKYAVTVELMNKRYSLLLSKL
ncbi:putative secreted protein (Por secretion system target) [Sediminibacterium goheungense]|uniref:Putative secreted protein (Por secretion system target) n=2 Tax=Sediminibacterium goheungense TaxID=1086393 RepID=A0A4R6IMI6_9BACT|nr:putative secreted protein (Por secretion system target) [Sediminibacterium goheungense]